MKKIYFGYDLTYLVIFIIEFAYYLKFNSTLFGLIYIVLNLLVLSLLMLSLINYKNDNVKIRISKNIFLIVIIFFLSFILPKLNFIDESKIFIDSIKSFIGIIDPLLILVLAIVSFLDFKFNNKRNYKIN